MANQYRNKVIFNGDTLIDLTSDTVAASDVAAGKYFHLATGERVQGTSTLDSDTSDGTANADEVLNGKIFYSQGNRGVGSMPNNGGTNVTVSSKAGATIPRGFSDGSAKAVIDSASSSALVPSNVRQGVTILGIEGTMSGQEDVNAQSKTVTPTASAQTVTPDTAQGYNYLAQVTVNAIPYTETDNAAGGVTVTIG